ncbi:MAG: hypothetical protein OXG33_05050 [Chloroflexi bacterium]|nr:hypothetical protein [Chloroflexota bacterium]
MLLVAVGVVGTSLALAYDRHWLSPWQFAPWIVLGIVVAATVGLAVRQTAVTVRLARVVAVLTMVGALLGAWQHIAANLDPESHDHQHEDRRESMTSAQDSHHHEETEGAGHHHDEGKADDHHAHGDEGAADDHHHADDEKRSASAAHDSPDEEPRPPSLLDVVIGAVGHAPIPAALSLAPIGLALGLATIGLGGSRTASKD